MSDLGDQSLNAKLQRFPHGEGRLVFAADGFESFSGRIATAADLYRKFTAVDTLLRACARVDESSRLALAGFEHSVGGKITIPGVYFPGHGGVYTCGVDLPPSERVPTVSRAEHICLLALNVVANRAIIYGNTGFSTPYREFAAIIDPALSQQAADVYYYDSTNQFQPGPDDRYIGTLLVEQLQAHEPTVI